MASRYYIGFSQQSREVLQQAGRLGGVRRLFTIRANLQKFFLLPQRHRYVRTQPIRLSWDTAACTTMWRHTGNKHFSATVVLSDELNTCMFWTADKSHRPKKHFSIYVLLQYLRRPLGQSAPDCCPVLQTHPPFELLAFSFLTSLAALKLPAELARAAKTITVRSHSGNRVKDK